MAARVFDIYNLNSPMVTPTAPPPQAAAPQAATTTRNSDRLMRGSAYLLVFAGALWLAALLLTVTPLRTVDVDLTVPFVAVVLGALAAMAWGVVHR